jgi:hypothetical protein
VWSESVTKAVFHRYSVLVVAGLVATCTDVHTGNDGRVRKVKRFALTRKGLAWRPTFERFDTEQTLHRLKRLGRKRRG